MTPTDEQLVQWAGDSGLRLLMDGFSVNAIMSGDALALSRLRRFAELAQEAEREACAKLVEQIGRQYAVRGRYTVGDHVFAAVIRARSDA